MQPKPYTQLPFLKRTLIGSAVVLLLLTVLEFGFGRFVLLYGIGAVALFYVVLIYRFLQVVYAELLLRRTDAQQTEALLWLYQNVSLSQGLPGMRHYAASPDLLKLVVRYCRELQPTAIVEAGSGTSTVVLADYLAQANLATQHLALDHMDKYARLTQQELTRPHSRAVHAPLQTYSLDGEDWLWYDLTALQAMPVIDLLVVDGPPENLQPLARYPALPLLNDRLSERAVIIMDDANRANERTIIDRWCREYGWQARFYDLEKGACVLTRVSASA